MGTIQKTRSLYSQLLFPGNRVELVDAVLDDYVTAAHDYIRYKKDYNYHSSIGIPTFDDILNDSGSGSVDNLIDRTASKLVLGSEDLFDLITDDNVSLVHVETEKLRDLIYDDVEKIIFHYHLSLCADRKTRAFLNMPVKKVW